MDDLTKKVAADFILIATICALIMSTYICFRMALVIFDAASPKWARCIAAICICGIILGAAAIVKLAVNSLGFLG
jgi:hypothetical protein